MEIEGVKVTRRRLLMAVSIGAGGLVTAVAAIPLIGFFLGPMYRKFPPVWRNVGPLDKFKIGATVQVDFLTSGGLPWDGPAQRVGAWLRRNNEQNFTVYSSKCTHLGCPVRWIPSAELFMCPCHGGVYFKNGDVAAGPPPEPLQQFPVRVQNGQVEVQWRPEQVRYAKLESPCGGCSGRSGELQQIKPLDREAV
ncbi:MAG TPA: ubiquinol-cytochrome c reductase iron-sulfur subunit [Bryobacteraceae bacterium]|nr:ubiquinol-cytochrome c reductase iron-sulfur subunit [Bryobacteraceae bacterium]